MFGHVKIQKLDDFFLTLDKRDGRGIYFYRINGYNGQIDGFIRTYYEEARSGGVVIEGRIPNPDGKQLSYYQEMMGPEFRLSTGFFASCLKKWLPRMKEGQRNAVAASMYDVLEQLKKNGKNEHMLKNAYIKFMCWLYYRFERIAGQLGKEKAPKVLYEGQISYYELLLLQILTGAGCDAVLLQYAGDGKYLELDAESRFSDCLDMPGMGSFPEGFSLRQIREEAQRQLDARRLYGSLPKTANCTNAWMAGKGLADFGTEVSQRGNAPDFFYNGFCRINGVEDKMAYRNELYRFWLELKNGGRKLVVVDGEIPPPTTEEIGAVKRKNYRKPEDMVLDLASNIKYGANAELQRLMVKAFTDRLLEEAEEEGASLNRLTNQAVILLCWLRRYQERLFGDWDMPKVGCFIHMGGCRNEKEGLFLRMLARLPVDVLALRPDLSEKCCLQDKLLYEINYGESLALEKFPQGEGGLPVGTVAYQAERELDALMYGDSGMYRNQQYGKAQAVTLQTIYEEIGILWKQELKYRPNFSAAGDAVSLPVIFAKVSGVKEGDLQAYWAGIKALLTGETYLIRQVPYIEAADENPVKPYVTQFFKKGKLLKQKIRQHPSYPYGMLREAVQEHILDKLQLLITRRTIKGTLERGTEYAIIATVLNMKKELVRLIQQFDFTKVNPKVVYINATDKAISLEDSILTAYLNLVGFDVVFFVPTGYLSVEGHFNGKIMEEHQIGGYMYDLQIPDFSSVPSGPRITWRDKLFGRKR